MNFSETFIKKPVMTMLVTFVIMAFGIAAYFKLPISDLPVVDYPVITVNVNYPGASPDTMASAVASPLENQFVQIPGIETILSSNTEGASEITLTFNLDRSVDLAAPDVQAAISRAAADLPTDLPAQPTYSKTNPSETPIVYLMMNSPTLTSGQLYDYANNSVGKRMSMIEGVSQVQLWGAKRAVRVQANPNKMAAYQIGINEIASAIKTGTVSIPGGSLDGTARTFSIEPQGQLLKAEDYENLIVAYRNNAPVRLREVAKCVESTDNDIVNVMFWKKGDKEVSRNNIVIAISRVSGSNTVDLSQKIRDMVTTLKKEIPGSVALDIFYDKSETIVESINDVKFTIVVALVLVILIIYLFLGRLSDTIIPSVALPFSLVATFILMYVFNFSLDNLSLMGLTLCVGFVVDDAIVVLENTVRLIEHGKKPMDAAIQSAKEITFTILSMTISLAVIFVPLIFMGGVVGRVFREFAVTVILAILCSGVISLTLTPMMCARMLKEKSSEETMLQKFMNAFMGRVISKYGEMLKWTLARPLTTLVAWLFCFLGTIALFFVLPQTFLPEGDSGAVQGAMLAPLGTSSKKMQQFQNGLNDTLRSYPHVDRLVSVTGLQPGADQSMGPFFAILDPLKERKRPIQDIVQDLRKKAFFLTKGYAFMQPMPSLEISTGGESTASGSKYSYVLTGGDKDALYKVALDFEQKVRKLPGFQDIQNSVKLNMPQLEVNMLRDRASTLGISANDISSALSLGYSGGKLTTYKTDIDQYQVILELDAEYQKNPENLSHIYLHSTKTGGLVPLSSVVQVTESAGPQNVPHYNQQNSATISFNLSPSTPIGDATKAIEELAAKTFPTGVTGFLQGEAQQFQEAVAGLTILIVIAIFIKYVVLGILYENYCHPFTILTTLPVATFGGLLTLLLFKSELSLYGYVGLFMLLGIVAKNGIMMVDFAKQNLETGKMTDFEAIYDACIVRFRPILMTGLAAIMGAVPIALGMGADGASRKPLGLIVVGGLIFSQVITLFVTPGIFLYMQKFQEKYLDKFELTRSDAARKAQGEE